jgi:gas vesicle protein
MKYSVLEKACKDEVKKIQEDADRRVQEAKTAAEQEAAKKYQELLRETKKDMKAAVRKKEEGEVTAPDSAAGRAE